MRNSSRTWLFRENEKFAQSLPTGSFVLDAGSGKQLYRAYFDHCTYEAADFEQVDKTYAPSTYVCDLRAIPVDAGRFDAVIFNQVMEHLPEPLVVLRELNRVMKPNGMMLCTAPLFYEEHETPYDFFRYTQFGWRQLMTSAGFTVERLEWLEGYFGTVAYQLETASRYLPRGPRGMAPGFLGWLAFPIVVVARIFFNLIARFFYVLDEQYRFRSMGFPKNYLVVVRKA